MMAAACVSESETETRGGVVVVGLDEAVEHRNALSQISKSSII